MTCTRVAYGSNGQPTPVCGPSNVYMKNLKNGPWLVVLGHRRKCVKEPDCQHIVDECEDEWHWRKGDTRPEIAKGQVE